MKYIERSFFDKYDIKPNVDYTKLMVLFQTKPDKRKDLPIVIQTIKSVNKLFIEELFTIHEDESLDCHKKILTILHENLNNVNDDIVIEFFNNYERCIKELKDKNIFYYSKNLSDEEFNNIMSEFYNAVLEKFFDTALLNLEKINSKTLSKIIEYLSKYNQKYILKIEDIISSKIEMMGQDNKEYFNNTLNYLYKLPQSLRERENIYKSYLFILDRIIKNEELYPLINENFILIIQILKEEDQKKYIKHLEDIAEYFIDLKNEKQFKYRFLCNNLKNLVSNYIFYLYNFRNDNIINEDKLLEYIKLLSVVYNTNSENWNEYKELIKQTKEDPSAQNIYYLIYHLIKYCNFPKELYRYLRLIIEYVTNISADFQELLLIKENTEGMIDNIDRKITSIVDAYSLLSYKDIRENAIRTEEVDDFLCKYYALTYISPDEFNATFIKNIKFIPFIIINVLKKYESYQLSQYSGVHNLTIEGAALREVLINCPIDWEFAGLSVSEWLEKLDSRLDYIYGSSKSSKYKEKYDVLFNNSKKTISNTLIDSINNAKNAQDKYDKAVKLENKNKLKEAEKIYESIIEYKDSKSRIAIIQNKLKEEIYNKAIKYSERGMYSEAINEFKKIENYKDSSKKIEINKVKYCDSIVAEAKVFISKGNYQAALEKYKSISKYRDVSKEIRECKNKIIEIKYQDALKLIESFDYEKALNIFNTIADYKDSKEKIILCEKVLNDKKTLTLYNDTIDLYNEYLSTNSYDYLLKAIEQMENLAKINYKNSLKLLELYKEEQKDYLNKKSRNRKISIFITIITVVVLIIGIILGIVFGIKNESYSNLISVVEKYDGHNKDQQEEIEKLISDIGYGYKDVKELEQRYYIKSINYEINNYIGDDTKINNLFKNISGNSAYIELYERYNKAKDNYIKYDKDYQTLLGYVENFDNLNNDKIDEIIKKLPKNYRNLEDLINDYHYKFIQYKILDYVEIDYSIENDIKELISEFFNYDKEYFDLIDLLNIRIADINNYNRLEILVNDYDAINNNEIERLISKISEDFLDLNNLKLTYYFKRLNYEIYNYNSYDKSVEEEINLLLKKVDTSTEGYNELVELYKSKKDLNRYNEVIYLMGNYVNIQTSYDIDNLLKEIPYEYKNTNLIKQENDKVKEYIHYIDNYISFNLSEYNSSQIRYNIRKLCTFIKSTNIWDISIYISEVNIKKFMYGIEWESSDKKYSIYYRRNDNNDGDWLSYTVDMVSEKKYNETYYFSIKEYDNYINFYISSQNDYINLANIKDIGYSNNGLYITYESIKTHMQYILYE